MNLRYTKNEQTDVQNVKIIYLFVFLLYVLLVVTGCATHSRTTRTTTTSAPVEQTTTTMTSKVNYEPHQRETVTTQENTQTTSYGDGGILGGALHVVGEVLAFPFRVVASLLDAIF